MQQRRPRHDTAARERRFVAAYLANGGHGTKAAIEAGYAPNSAKDRASEILSRPHVADLLEAKRHEIDQAAEKKAVITKERVLRELRRVALSKVDDFENGPNGIRVRKGRNPSAIRAVSAVRLRVRRYTGKDGRPVEEVDQSFKLWDKPSALRVLAEHTGVIGPANNDGASGVEILLTGPDLGLAVRVTNGGRASAALS